MKGQLAILASGAVVFVGSFAVSPTWRLGPRLLASLILPIGLEVALTLVCLFMMTKIWRLERMSLSENRHQITHDESDNYPG